MLKSDRSRVVVRYSELDSGRPDFHENISRNETASKLAKLRCCEWDGTTIRASFTEDDHRPRMTLFARLKVRRGNSVFRMRRFVRWILPYPLFRKQSITPLWSIAARKRPTAGNRIWANACETRYCTDSLPLAATTRAGRECSYSNAALRGSSPHGASAGAARWWSPRRPSSTRSSRV